MTLTPFLGTPPFFQDLRSVPRKPRLFIEGYPQHIIQRGNNRQAIFFADSERQQYLEWLGETAEEQGLRIHAYVLMTNHVHLLATPEAPDSVSKTMQAVGRRYVQYINRRHDRSGTLWAGRYRSALVDSASYYLVCSRYIELNPMRAGLVRRRRDYAWSSYRRNAEGRHDDLLREHPVYTALGPGPEARCQAYSRLFEEEIPARQMASIRTATNQGGALGPAAFLEAVEQRLGRPAGVRPRGRPRGLPRRRSL